MAEQWKMVRVRRSTFLMIEQARQRMQLAYERGKLPMPRDPMNNGRVSLDTAIFLLAARDADHAKRRRKSAAKARQKKPAAESGPAAGAIPE